MTNKDAPMGFVPKVTPGCSSPPINSMAPQGYSIASGYSTNIFQGGPVALSGTASADGKPGLVAATVGDSPVAVVGVLAYVEYVDTNGITQRGRWPASTVATQITAYVFDDPRTQFEIQGDEDIVAGDIGNKADFTAETGDTITGQSTIELDSSNIGTGDALKIMGIQQRPDNAFGTHAKALVMFREHAGNNASGLPVAG